MKNDNIQVKKGHGGCEYSKYNPELTEVANNENFAINYFVSFEEAMKLNIALQSAILKLNGYNRTSKDAKNKKIKMTIHFKNKRIAVY